LPGRRIPAILCSSCRAVAVRTVTTIHHPSDNPRRPSHPIAGPVEKTRLDAAELEAFGREIVSIRREVTRDLGERDEGYFRRVLAVQRRLELAGRAVIFASLGFHPWWGHAWTSWPVLLVVLVLGALTLTAAKILDNMEIGHNVMHGQWDWLRDPRIRASTWEWDNACPSPQWRNFHNVIHHDWTNVLGKDRDLGFGALRVNERQRWRAGRLAQPVSSLMLALFFEWGLASHGVQLGRYKRGEMSAADLRGRLSQVARKVLRQLGKDYLFWPILAGPFFLYVCAANLAANLIRNVWVYAIIICGHFPERAQVFTQQEVENETRAGWYLRQVVGSCNVSGGRWFHYWTGNLSHQIEHHLFPDLPSNRYGEIAPRLEAVCAAYGVPYNVASLGEQLGSAQWRIVRLSLPGRGRVRLGR
jgi:NADPH-dependent stearoyl-CoA 9-desaturase